MDTCPGVNKMKHGATPLGEGRRIRARSGRPGSPTGGTLGTGKVPPRIKDYRECGGPSNKTSMRQGASLLQDKSKLKCSVISRLDGGRVYNSCPKKQRLAWSVLHLDGARWNGGATGALRPSSHFLSTYCLNKLLMISPRVVEEELSLPPSLRTCRQQPSSSDCNVRR